MPRDRRLKRDRHALNDEGLILCNPRDKEAAHRASVGDLKTGDCAEVTCKKCYSLLAKLEKSRLKEH